MKTTERIEQELLNGRRITKVKLIEELSRDEYETTHDVFVLAQKTDAQIDLVLNDLYSFYHIEESYN